MRVKFGDLKNEEFISIANGMIICNNLDFCQITNEIEASIELFDLPKE